MSPQWNDHTEALAADGAGKQRGADRPGRRVRAIRAERGLSRADVARASGFSVREIAKIERRGDRVTFEEWRALAGGLGVPVGDLAPHGARPSETATDDWEDAGDDGVPLDLVDLELDDFLARVRGDVSGADVVMSAALDELDTGRGTRAARRASAQHRRRTPRATNELRLRLTTLDDLCTEFVATEDRDVSASLAAEIVLAVELVRSCREFREVAAAQRRR